MKDASKHPLQEMFTELLNGVDWKSFFDVCDFVRGITYNKQQEARTEIDAHKVLRANNITLNFNTLNFDDVKFVVNDVKVKPTQLLYRGDILMCAGSGSKEHIGKVAYINEDMDYTFGGFMSVVRCKEVLLPRFMFHILTGGLFTQHLEREIKSSTINNINNQVMQSLSIPVPPLPVQEEIVRILDNFTNLAAELQAELQARRKQYQYYRDTLLSFKGRTDVEWKKLGEIGVFYGGLSGKTKDDFTNGNAKFISYKNVFYNLSLNVDTDERVKIGEGEKQNTVIYGDILFTGSSETPDECGMSSVLTQKTDEKLYLNSFCFGYRLHNHSLFCLDFLKHLFRSNELRKQIGKTASGTTRFNVSKKRFAEVSIPIPPFPVQKQIADILDKFYTLTADLTAGLPAEIEARRKQYEYYRDRLLRFKRM